MPVSVQRRLRSTRSILHDGDVAHADELRVFLVGSASMGISKEAARTVSGSVGFADEELLEAYERFVLQRLLEFDAGL
jgi:hypothetical protein